MPGTYRCVDALSTERAIRDWIFGGRWDFFFGTEDMRKLAFNISGDSFNRDSQPAVQEGAPRVEMYCSFREVWAGERDISVAS